ncbi:high mobility group B protein 6-like [Eucalyptus grandis]|uniref:high mobility group B protein 6-like n=1 Tax=Eucalyptus grandis TaxID=71139 RepID=UPI00192EB48A|nr:high mobility group B protein 6-like [Eucalyptus grandis]
MGLSSAIAMKEQEELATACIVELDNSTGSITTPNKSKPRENSKKQLTTPTSSHEKKLQEMQEMIKKLKVENAKMENMLKKRDEMIRQKDRELEAKERELEKFRCEFKKLQKVQDLKLAMMFPIGHAERDIKHMKEKKKGLFEERRPSTPYIPWCKDRWNKIKGNKFYEEKDQEVYIEVLRMGLNRLKHEMKVTNERVDQMSSNLQILRGDMLNTKTELSKKENETKEQNELALQKFKDHKTQWKIAREATEDEAIKPSTYEEASQCAEWKKTKADAEKQLDTMSKKKVV